MTIKDFGCNGTRFNLKQEYNDSYYVIEDSIKFNEYVEYECDPHINFSKYALIIGSKCFNNGTIIKSMTLKENCFRIKLEIVFDNRGAIMVAPVLQYHAIINKPMKNQEINVKVKIID